MADMWVIVSVSLMQQTPVSVTWGHSCRGQDTQPASGAQHVGSCGGKQSRGLPQEGTLGCAWGSILCRQERECGSQARFPWATPEGAPGRSPHQPELSHVSDHISQQWSLENALLSP